MTYVDYAFIGLVVGCIYALYGLGLTVVYKATRVPNFAQGAMGTIVAFVFYKCWGGSGIKTALLNHDGFYFKIPFLGHHSWGRLTMIPPSMPMWEAFLVSMVVAVILGLVIARIMRPFARASTVTLMIVSFGLFTVLLGLAYDAFSGYGSQVHHLVPIVGHVHQFHGFFCNDEQLMIIGVTLVLTVALAAFFRYTHLGVAIRSVADDRDVSRLLGINVNVVSAVSWVLGAVLAGIAGILLSPLISLDLEVLTGLIVFGFVASLLGGFRSLPGTLLGGIVLGVIEQVIISSPLKSVTWLPPLKNIIPFVAIVLLLLTRPKWIFSGIRVDEESGVGGASVTFGGQAPAEDRLRAVLRRHAALWVTLRDWKVARWILGTALLGFLLVFPIFSTGYWSAVLTTGVIFTLVALSLVILTGWAGQVSLCQYAFVGVGAFTAAVLSGTAHLPFWLVVPLVVLLSLPFSLLIGIPSLRLRGFFLALVTLAFAVAIDLDIFQWHTMKQHSSVQWGGLGGTRIHRPFSIDSEVFYLSLAVALACFFVAYNLRRSRTGRAFLAIRDSEPTAIAFGINPTKYKLIAFCVSGAVAAAAGAVYGYLYVNMDASGFFFVFSITFIGYGVLMGLSESLGAVLVGFFGAVLPQLIAQPVNGENQSFPIITGVLLILTVYSYPTGMAGFLKRLVRPDDETPLILAAGEFQTAGALAEAKAATARAELEGEAEEEAVWAGASLAGEGARR